MADDRLLVLERAPEVERHHPPVRRAQQLQTRAVVPVVLFRIETPPLPEGGFDQFVDPLRIESAEALQKARLARRLVQFRQGRSLGIVAFGQRLVDPQRGALVLVQRFHTQDQTGQPAQILDVQRLVQPQLAAEILARLLEVSPAIRGDPLAPGRAPQEQIDWIARCQAHDQKGDNRDPQQRGNSQQ